MDELRSDVLGLALRVRKHGARHFGLMPAQPGLDLRTSGIELAGALAQVSGRAACFFDFTGRHSGEGRLIERRAHCDVIGGAIGVANVRAALASARENYAHIVVDLSGYKARGEHLEAVALLDGVLQFVQFGVTTEAAVLRHQMEFPTSANLGIVTIAC